MPDDYAYFNLNLKKEIFGTVFRRYSTDLPSSSPLLLYEEEISELLSSL